MHNKAKERTLWPTLEFFSRCSARQSRSRTKIQLRTLHPNLRQARRGRKSSKSVELRRERTDGRERTGGEETEYMESPRGICRVSHENKQRRQTEKNMREDKEEQTGNCGALGSTILENIASFGWEKDGMYRW